MTALIMPLDDGVEKDRKKGIHYVRFGCIWVHDGLVNFGL